MAKTDGGLQFNRHDYHQMYGIGWHAQRTSEPRELGRQLTNRTLHDSHEQSLSHHPYRREEPYKFLRHYCATPHSSTWKTLVEVPLNRLFPVRFRRKTNRSLIQTFSDRS